LGVGKWTALRLCGTSGTGEESTAATKLDAVYFGSSKQLRSLLAPSCPGGMVTCTVDAQGRRSPRLRPCKACLTEITWRFYYKDLPVKETVAVECENCMERVNAVCEEKCVLLILKQVVHIVTTEYQSVLSIFQPPTQAEKAAK
jgi:hypothetical protein